MAGYNIRDWAKPVVPRDPIRAGHWNALVDFTLRNTLAPGGVDNSYSGRAQKRDYRRPTVIPSTVAPVLVKCVSDGGVAGDLTTKCTRTYSIYPGDATTLDSTTLLKAAVLPQQARQNVGFYRLDTTGGWAYGLAVQLTPGNNSSYILLHCFGEVADAEGC